MQAQSSQSELREFVQFACHRLEVGGDHLSIEELVTQWRQNSEFAQAVADVRQGIIDDAQGKAQAVSTAFADIRRNLGIVD